jgi:hypothetical protein
MSNHKREALISIRKTCIANLLIAIENASSTDSIADLLERLNRHHAALEELVLDP